MYHEVPSQNSKALPLESGENRVLNRIICTLVAEEMEIIRTSLEEIGMQLCENVTIAREFTETLQNIDRLAQKNENLARLLRSDDMEPVIDLITLDSLRDRLLDGVAHALADIENDSEGAAGTIWNSF